MLTEYTPGQYRPVYLSLVPSTDHCTAVCVVRRAEAVLEAVLPYETRTPVGAPHSTINKVGGGLS